MNEYVNKLFQKYGLSTSLEERVGLEFIDKHKSLTIDDISESASHLETESQITSQSFIGPDQASPCFR